MQKTETLVVKVDPSMKDDLRQFAVADRRSLGSLIRLLLEKGLANLKQEGKE